MQPHDATWAHLTWKTMTAISDGHVQRFAVVVTMKIGCSDPRAAVVMVSMMPMKSQAYR